MDQYEELQVSIHKLYEEMFSVQDGPSSNSGQLWQKQGTLGGVFTHPERFLHYYELGDVEETLEKYGLNRRHAFDIVIAHLTETHLEGNYKEMQSIRDRFQRGYYGAAGSEELVNAAANGGVIPQINLEDRLAFLQDMRDREEFAMLFTHKSFREFAAAAIDYYIAQGKVPLEVAFEGFRGQQAVYGARTGTLRAYAKRDLSPARPWEV